MYIAWPRIWIRIYRETKQRGQRGGLETRDFVLQVRCCALTTRQLASINWYVTSRISQLETGREDVKLTVSIHWIGMIFHSYHKSLAVDTGFILITSGAKTNGRKNHIQKIGMKLIYLTNNERAWLKPCTMWSKLIRKEKRTRVVWSVLKRPMRLYLDKTCFSANQRAQLLICILLFGVITVVEF